MDEEGDEGPLLTLIKIEKEDLNLQSEEDEEGEDANKNVNDFYEMFEIKVENLDYVIGDEQDSPDIYYPNGKEMETEGETEIYPCIMCNFQSTSLQDITEHISTHDRTSRFQCQFCDYQSNSKYDFEIHLRKHHKSRILPTFKCKECLFETQHKQSLKRHYLRHRAPAEEHLFYCYQCRYKSRFKHNLKIHLLLHADKGYASTSKESPMYYEKSFYNHYDYKYISKDKTKCLLCGFTSKYSHYVKKHMRRNHRTEMGIDSKVFQCFHCTFKTKIKYSLQMHLSRVHQKGVVWSCKKKEKKITLKQGDKYVCEICNFKAYHISEIEVHKLSHDNIEHSSIFKCKICNFKTIYKSCVKRHRFTHQEKTIKCNLCKYSAKRNDEMKGHILRRHGKQKSKEQSKKAKQQSKKL